LTEVSGEVHGGKKLIPKPACTIGQGTKKTGQLRHAALPGSRNHVPHGVLEAQRHRCAQGDFARVTSETLRLQTSYLTVGFDGFLQGTSTGLLFARLFARQKYPFEQ
jgi:hypothetical protein